MFHAGRAMAQYLNSKQTKREVVEVTFNELVAALVEKGESKEDAEFHAKTCEILGSQIQIGNKWLQIATNCCSSP